MYIASINASQINVNHILLDLNNFKSYYNNQFNNKYIRKRSIINTKRFIMLVKFIKHKRSNYIKNKIRNINQLMTKLNIPVINKN